MVAWILRLVTGKAMIPLMLAGAVTIAGLSFVGGVKWESGKWAKAQVSAMEQAAEQRLELELTLAVRDEQLVEALNAKRVEYRTVYKKVPTAVNRTECRVDTSGLQVVVDQIRSANSRRGYDAAVRSDTGAPKRGD
jgi:hypothetical protein